MALLAPGRLSATTVWPRRFSRPCVTLRAVMSEEPPGTNGTMMVIGFAVGHSLAKAGVAAIAPARQVAANASVLRVRIELECMVCLLRESSFLWRTRPSHHMSGNLGFM